MVNETLIPDVGATGSGSGVTANIERAVYRSRQPIDLSGILDKSDGGVSFPC